MEIYRNIPRPPHCRAAGTWPPGCRAAGAYLQKRQKKLQTGPWGPAAQLRGGRPPALNKVLAPSPPFGLLKIQKKKEKRGREGEEG